MEDGRTWGSSQDLMSRTLTISDSTIELGTLTNLKSFQVTSSHNNRTSSGSSTPRLMNAAACDLESSESDEINSIIYGGQKVDNGLTSDEIVLIKGTIKGDIGTSNIDVTRYPAQHVHYTTFPAPLGWPDGSHLVQVGEVPEGRTGSSLSKVKQYGSSNLLVSIGGHSKSNFSTDFHHPASCINLLIIPEMRWWKLSRSEILKRSFHSESTNDDGNVFVLGGMSMKNGCWSIIHPLTQLIKIHINDDFTYSEVVINLTTEIEHLPFITNFTTCKSNDFFFVFGGFHFPEYDPDEENLSQFQPPIAKRNKLPKLSSALFKIDLRTLDISSSSSLVESGSYNGSGVCVSSSDGPVEIIFHADPKILLYSERVLQSPKCELPEEFGSCSMSVVDKRREFYYCSTPICELKIHIRCDKSLKRKAGDHQFCPKCRHLDPKTWKQIPGTTRPRWRTK